MAAISDSEIVTAVRPVLPELQALPLFGSRAASTDRADSDLDLAVLLPGRADAVRLWQTGAAVADG